MRASVFVLGSLIAFGATLHAQSPSAASPSQPAPQPAASAPKAEAGDAYTYTADGRRDPFLNLLGTGTEPPASGMAVAEISVRGVLQTRGALVAMIVGPDNKTYIVHQGDKLADGTIKTITPQGLIVIQDVNDPLSLVKQREVSKLLRASEGAK
jgi:hypothetical protein